MSSHTCPRCGAVTDPVLPGGLCVTCHGRQDDTRQSVSVAADAPTPSFDPDAAGTLTFATPADTTLTRGGETGADPFGVLPAGGYVCGEVLGTGGMGCVYKAVRRSTGQTVAVKKLRPERYYPSLLRRFAREAQILGKLNHPNVVRLYDFVPDPGDPHLVMEFVDGCSLSDRLTDGKGLPPDAAARLMADAARGVAAAHAAGVVHRDLKPGNLLVSKTDQIKVSDFGLGMLTDADDGLTLTDQPIGGTPGYAAPEQVAEGGVCDERTDVWGLGACLHACLVGKPPYPSGRANLTRVLSDPLVPPRAVNPAVPAVLDAIVVKCLDRDPANRYPTAADVAADLDRYRRGESTVAKPLPWAARAWRRARRVPRAAVIAAVVAAALTAGIVLAVMLPRREPATIHPLVTGDAKEVALAAFKAELNAGRPVTLIPAKGQPEWFKWLAGAATLGSSDLRDGGVQFQTAEVSYLCLADDPQVHSYRVEAEFRHMAARPPHSRCGLFVGFDERRGQDGETVRSVLSVEFSDYWDDSEFVAEVQASHGVTLFDRCEYQPAAGTDPLPRKTEIGSLRVPPALAASGKWRKVAVEVSPLGASGFWWDDRKGEWVRVAHAAPDRVVRIRNEYLDELANRMIRPAVVPAWVTRGPLGVYAFNGTVCLRNVTLQPQQ